MKVKVSMNVSLTHRWTSELVSGRSQLTLTRGRRELTRLRQVRGQQLPSDATVFSAPHVTNQHLRRKTSTGHESNQWTERRSDSSLPGATGGFSSASTDSSAASSSFKSVSDINSFCLHEKQSRTRHRSLTKPERLQSPSASPCGLHPGFVLVSSQKLRPGHTQLNTRPNLEGRT